ncbi:hypothetical protein AB205_0070110, partial [Aquarana catesbeiana]
MTEEEFKKLWNRYVREDSGTLGIEDLRSHLGAKKMSTKVGSRTRNERKLSLSIEKWLKERFREGVRAMMAEFLVCDPDRTHKVSREDFLKVLDKFQLHLTGDQLCHFLARCGLNENSSDIDYVDFLQRLQTRRNSGRAHKILSKENRFCIKVTDEEFSHLLERIPVDQHGAIRYLDFMAKFDSGDENLSLWSGNKTILTNCSQKPQKINKVSAKGKSDKPQGKSVEQKCPEKRLEKSGKL